MSTTEVGKSCCFRIFLIIGMRLDLTGVAPCGTGADECWEHTGIEPRRSAECEDVGGTVVVGDATVERSAVRRSESPWCLGSPWSSGDFRGLWELEGMRTLDLSRPKIWRGRLPFKLCRPGRVKCKLYSPESPLWRTSPLGGSLRQRTAWVRSIEEAVILSDLDCWVETGHPQSHSWLRECGLDWKTVTDGWSVE